MNKRAYFVAIGAVAVILMLPILLAVRSTASVPKAGEEQSDRKTTGYGVNTVRGNRLVANALAPSRPAVHWSTFEKVASPCACHLFALRALRQEGLDKIYEDTGSIILAGNNGVVAEIVCLPDNRHIRLSAFSSDSETAAATRSRLRETIVKSTIIDTCP